MNTSSPRKSLLSYVNVPGSWDTRKISLTGVARSLISQLQIGTDLTRVLLPADFQAPYSLLEVCAARYMGHWHILVELESDDPFVRFLAILRWFLASTMELKFERKPYNPDLGETHIATLGSTTFFAEQVMHHPPITAFAIVDPTNGIELQGNIGADVRFRGNGVTAETTGFVDISHKSEVYHFNKGLPAMTINNVILGTRSMNWTGTVAVTCAVTAYSANLEFSGNTTDHNIVSAVILKEEKPLYRFTGCWAKDRIYLQPTDNENVDAKQHHRSHFHRQKTSKGEEIKNEDFYFFDHKDIQKETNLVYPNLDDPTETLNVWQYVTAQIVNEQLALADEANVARRLKNREKSEDAPLKYFMLSEGKYVLNPNFKTN